MLIIIIVLLFVVGYSALVKNSSLSSGANYAQTSKTESDIIASLKANWQSVQALVPSRPSYSQDKSGTNVWQTPYIVQFIGKDNILIEIEDDNNAHVVVLHSNGNQFGLLEFFKNQYNFTLSDYQSLVKKYGDSSYETSTYTIGLVRNKETIMFPNLTKVPENIFLKGYSIASSS